MLSRLMLLSLLIISGLPVTAQAAERVDIVPRKIIMQSRDRSGEFTLLNTGDQDSTFRIEIINYRQDETGTYHPLDKPLDPRFDPESVLRLSPRQFTIPQGGRQKVRFSLRKPADLPDGEYRFHISSTRMAEYGPPALSGKGAAVGMTMNTGVAIPVIVRHGQVQASATLSDARYIAANANGKPELDFTINRRGNASLIGDAKAIINQDGKDIVIGSLSNLNVFNENAKRLVKMPLSQATQSPIRLIYNNDETKTPYAETTVQP